MSRYVLAIDEGSTGVRALLFDRNSAVAGAAYEEIRTTYPQVGWVEQNPQHIWDATRRVVRAALAQARARPADVAAIGITNQRATTLVWERASGQPLYPAISWQDARGTARVEELLANGIFTNSLASLSKIEWILQHSPDGVARAEAGALCIGTIDTWLAWQLSGGRAHVTDPSNASCTGLLDFMNGGWDTTTASHTCIPLAAMPNIRSSSEVYGESAADVFGARVPIAGIAGDQQAAMFGELGLEHGSVKVTYGTSGMVDVNTGDFPVLSQRGAYPLVLWAVGGRRPFVLEGTVVTAGATVQWLRDGLGVIASAEESGPLAASVVHSDGVWAVPALQGLGTPYMDPSARAVIGGLSRGSTRAHVVRAVLEGIAFRSREVLHTLVEDAQVAVPAVLRVDGGAAANDFLLQCLADVLGVSVERPQTVQASALGVAYLAGLATGVWSGVDELRHAWRSGGVFAPRWSASERDERFHTWQRAVASATARA